MILNMISYLFDINITLFVQTFYLFYRYYSMYGHVEKLAEEIKKGAASVEGVEATLWQVSMHFIIAFRPINYEI